MNMNKLITVAVLGVTLLAAAGPDMSVDADKKGAAVTMGEGVGVDMSDQTEHHVTPLSLSILEWGVPFSRGWSVYGIRLNLSVPGWHPEHRDLYGIDFGLSGEINGDAAGICVNFFDNVCQDFGGIQIGGLYNRINGDSPFGMQFSLGHNRSMDINGLQIGGWNVANEMRGLQFGLINHAEGGAGLQIGLWNECGTQGSPILGAIF